MDLEEAAAEHVLQAAGEAEQAKVWLQKSGGWDGVGGEAGGVAAFFTATAWGGAGIGAKGAEEQPVKGAEFFLPPPPEEGRQRRQGNLTAKCAKYLYFYSRVVCF